jgi:two-component system phosphate regulon sensor histidine kinase PhoR
MEYFGIIFSEAQRLSKLVNAILNFSHIESGQRHYQMKEFILQDLLQDIARAYRFHAQQKGFTFTLDVPEEPIPLNADYEALTEAVINLIDNGMKYSTDVKEISLRCGEEETMVFIEVSDKGIGFPAAERKRIFDKFYRVPTGNVHNVKGSGIGLSIVKHVIDAHEGKIEVESAPGEGSRFKLLVPKPL